MDWLLNRLGRAPSQAASALLDWFMPPRCAACEELTGDGSQTTRFPFCESCAVSLVDNESACPRCAEPLATSSSHLMAVPECHACIRRPPPQQRTYAPYEYGGQLAVVLRLLKHQRRRDLARTLAPILSQPLADAIARGGAETIVPVPLGYWRMATRGFNQSATLARYAAKGLGVGVDSTALLRVRRTAPQAGLSRRARERNVTGAFAVPARNARRISGRRILVFDDIMTTGATARHAAKALLAAGAASVEVFACARATELY